MDLPERLTDFSSVLTEFNSIWSDFWSEPDPLHDPAFPPPTRDSFDLPPLTRDSSDSDLPPPIFGVVLNTDSSSVFVSLSPVIPAPTCSSSGLRLFQVTTLLPPTRRPFFLRPDLSSSDARICHSSGEQRNKCFKYLGERRGAMFKIIDRFDFDQQVNKRKVCRFSLLLSILYGRTH
ncbi:hypothetical protein LXL04_038388 [Taraxacum kok-saghyz]